MKTPPRVAFIIIAALFVAQSVFLLIWLLRIESSAWQYNAQELSTAIIAYEKKPTASTEKTVRLANQKAMMRAWHAQMPTLTLIILSNGFLIAVLFKVKFFKKTMKLKDLNKEP
jgi:hypothetical protein